MEAGSRPTTGGRGSQRGLLWGLLLAVLVLAAVVAGCSGEEAVTVPNVVGMEEIEARDALSDADLELGDVERLAVEADAPEIGTVLSQAPSAGIEVDSGSEVSLIVAGDPDEATDEDEAPPAATGGGSGTGTEVKPTDEPSPEAKKEQRSNTRSGMGKGTVGYVGSTLVTQSTRLSLFVRLTSESGGFFYLQLRDAGSGETATQFGFEAKAGRSLDYSEERQVPMSTYRIWVQASPDCSWHFSLAELH